MGYEDKSRQYSHPLRLQGLGETVIERGYCVQAGKIRTQSGHNDI